MKHSILVKVLSLLVLLHLSACFAVPFISGFREMGATAAARRSIFNKTVEGFNAAIKSADMTVAMSYVDEENSELRRAIRAEMRRNREKERIVSSEIDFVEYDDDAYNADVEVRTKYFLVPYYVVNERLETEHWEFSIGSKWQLKSRSVEELRDGEPVKLR